VFPPGELSGKTTRKNRCDDKPDPGFEFLRENRRCHAIHTPFLAKAARVWRDCRASRQSSPKISAARDPVWRQFFVASTTYQIILCFNQMPF
jgi:hypothetical protein